MSCILYHGPGARTAAIKEAESLGRLLAPPLGEEGLKTSRTKPADPPGAREIVGMLSSAPLGTKVGCLVVGPIDEAEERAATVLLKSIEEFRSDLFALILWAHDLGVVLPTIRSRCLPRWAGDREAVSPELVADGEALVRAYLNQDLWEVPLIVARHKGEEHRLLQQVAVEVHAHQIGPLWEALRPVAARRNPTQIEVIAAFLGGPTDE